MSRAKHGSAIVDEFGLWLASLRERGRSPRTVATYGAAIKNLARFLADRRVRAITHIRREHLNAWRTALDADGCAPATIELFVRAVREGCKCLVQRGRLFASPAEGLMAPRVDSTFGVIPSEAEMRGLLESIDDSDAVARRDRALLETAYATGARLSELAQLEMQALDFANGLVRILGKGGRERVVPLTASAANSLAEYLANGRPVFVREGDEGTALWLSSRGGRRLTIYAIEGIVRRRAARLGLVLTPHAIRRGFATHLLRAGAHPADLRELLGHRSFRHLAHYLRVHPAEVTTMLRDSRLGRR